MPLVSVLLPNYNNAPFLKESIDSILNQTFKDFELLIVDDGSTDNSIDIINSFTDKRIRLIQKKVNSGIVDTLNIGLDAIDSKYMVRMDGDDISMPERLEKLVSFLEKNKLVGVCSSALKVFGNVKQEVWKIDTAPDLLKAGLIRGVTTPHAPSMFRMSVLIQNNLKYRKNIPHMEDYDLFFRLKKYTAFFNLHNALYCYRILDHNVTIKNKDSIWERYKLIYKEVLQELGIEASAKNIAMHIELFHRVRPVCSVNDLFEYKNLLIKNNNNYKIYPEKAFLKIIDRWWTSLFCRLIDVDYCNYKKFKKIGVSLTLSQEYYYYRSRYKITKHKNSYRC